jgi:hypothetical protein
MEWGNMEPTVTLEGEKPGTHIHFLKPSPSQEDTGLSNQQKGFHRKLGEHGHSRRVLPKSLAATGMLPLIL